MEFFASVGLALIWLQVGVYEFASTQYVVSFEDYGEKDRIVLVATLELYRHVCAVSLWVILKWAVV